MPLSTPNSPPLLRISWRSQILSLPLTPTLTLTSLKCLLHSKTQVPPNRQTLLFSIRRPLPENKPLLNLLPLPPPPILLLGTPNIPSDDHTNESADIVNDLDELTQDPEPPSIEPIRPIPPSIRRPVFEQTVEQVEVRPVSVMPSLEELDRRFEALAVGPAFAEIHNLDGNNAPLWAKNMEDSLLLAVQKAKRSDRMLAVVVLDFSEDKEEQSRELLRKMTQQGEALREFLESFFEVLVVEGGGEGLGVEVGVVVVGEVGGGGVVVLEVIKGGGEVLEKLRGVVEGYDGFYEVRRGLRGERDERLGVLREQDEELERAMSIDKERESVEREEREQQDKREKEELELEQKRKGEMELARTMLPKEPERGSGTRIVVRLPDGRRVERGFGKGDSVSDLFNWVVSEGVVKGSFELRAVVLKKVLKVEDGGESMEEAGLVPSVALNVEC